MTQSLIIGLIIKFVTWLKNAFDLSLFYKFQKFVSNLWQRLISGSVFADYFKTYPKTLKGSAVIKGKLLSWLKLMFGKIYTPLSNSLIFGTVNGYYKGFFTRSVRAYGMYVFSVSAVCLAFGGSKYPPLFAAVAALGVVAIIADKSIKELFANSIIYKYAVKLFELNVHTNQKSEANSFASLCTHTALGVVSGVVAVLTDSPLVPALFVALVIAGFALYDYRVGIYASLISMPFAPTMGVVFMVLVSAFSFVIKALTDSCFKFRHTPLDAPVALFALVLFISAVTSFAPVSSIKIFLVYFAFVLGFYLTVNAVRTKSQLYALIISMLFAGVLVALYGIYQHIFGFAEGTTWTDTEMFEDIATRVVSTFGNPNVLGEYLLLLIPVSAGYILSRPSAFNKTISIGITALLAVCMVFTYSRGNWIGLIVAMILFCMFYDGRIAWLGVLAAFFVPVLMPQTVINRFMSIGDTTDTSTSYRVYIWMGSIAMLKDYWMSGIGLGSDAFNMIYPFYSYSGIVAPHSHNLYLHILVENGIMGMVVFLVIVFTYYRMAISTIVLQAKDKMLKATITGLAAGMFGYLVQGMFDNVWYNYRIVFMFYIIVALTCCAILIQREAEKC